MPHNPGLVWFDPEIEAERPMRKAIFMNELPTNLTAARAAKARENLVNALRECGELADAVAHFQGRELIEVLDYLDSLRFVMAESGQLLAGVTRGSQA
jgi:hypothetical protein